MKTLETCQRKEINASSEQLSTHSKPPVPKGFEVLQDDEKGFFVFDGILFWYIYPTGIAGHGKWGNTWLQGV